MSERALSSLLLLLLVIHAGGGGGGAAAATSSSASFARICPAAHSRRIPPKYANTRPPSRGWKQRHHKSDVLQAGGYATARKHANAQPSTEVHTTNPPNQHVVKHEHTTNERGCTDKTEQGGFTSDRPTNLKITGKVARRGTASQEREGKTRNKKRGKSNRMSGEVNQKRIDGWFLFVGVLALRTCIRSVREDRSERID